jgi:hypothetical protein
MQLMAYAEALRDKLYAQNHNRVVIEIANLFIDRATPNAILHRWDRDQHKRLFDMFTVLQTYWTIKNNHYPGNRRLPYPEW